MHMKKWFLVLMLFPIATTAQKWKLSDQAEISVITCGPFQGELYSAFGHSAFRVNDPALGFDAAYNYGVFNFKQPNFYLNFARGRLYYMLGVYDYQAFQQHYIEDNRFVHEQVLNLSTDQKQKLFDYLQWNARPENQYYRYDYFYDNCATKMRDVLLHVFGDTVKFDGSYIVTDYTIRELTDLYLTEQPWGDLGIDICLGLPMDKKAAPLEYMFLPDYVESGFDHATIVRDGEEVAIVKKKNIIYESRAENYSPGFPHPFLFLVPLALVAAFLTYRDIRRHTLTIAFDAIVFGFTGIIGILLFSLWFFTDHDAAARNMNILWALPLHLVAVIAFIRNPRWLKWYFGVIAILSLLLLVSWPVLPQKLHYALIPIVVMQGLRAFAQYKVRLHHKKRTNELRPFSN
jgi:hypothetical protein